MNTAKQSAEGDLADVQYFVRSLCSYLALYQSKRIIQVERDALTQGETSPPDPPDPGSEMLVIRFRSLFVLYNVEIVPDVVQSSIHDGYVNVAPGGTWVMIRE